LALIEAVVVATIRRGGWGSPRKLDADASALGRVLRCVREQVEDDLPDARGIEGSLDSALRALSFGFDALDDELDRLPALGKERLHLVDDALGRHDEVGVGELVGHLLARELREVERIVEKAQEATPGL